MNRSLIAVFITALGVQTAGAFELTFPVDCTLGQSCAIQNYPDRDPGPDAADFTCGSLSYDGHDGTDIRLPDLAAMAKGVTVRAAAAGVVLGLRDGMADISIRDPAAPDLNGQDCGNGVLIDHGDGWQTQYCHMARGSIAVARGQRVDAGTPLGRIGLSGNTEFPHLHLTLRHNGAAIDPFTAQTLTAEPACGADPGPGLWATPVPYAPGGLLSVGLTDHIPDFDAVKAGLPSPALTRDAPALVVWAQYFGPRRGDAILLTITGPKGEVIRDRVVVEKTQSLAFRAAGRKRPAGGWPAGPYLAEVRLIRAGAVLGVMTAPASMP